MQWNDIDIASGITFGDTWQTHTVTVTGTGSDTLSFADAGTSDGLGTFLDNVSVVASDVPLFTGQSIQPATPNIISFTVVGPTSTVNEGDVANFTISTTPAPTTPLDVTIRVSSSTGHVDTTNHTVTIPTSGSAVLSVQTIDTPIDQPGILQVSILDTATYLVDGIGGVTITIDDPGSDNLHVPPGEPSIHISGPSVIYKGEFVPYHITYADISNVSSDDPGLQWNDSGTWRDIFYLDFAGGFMTSPMIITPSSLSGGFAQFGNINTDYQIRVKYAYLPSGGSWVTVYSDPITVRVLPAFLARSGPTTVEHLKPLYGDGIWFDFIGPTDDVQRIDWKVNGKTYKTVQRECEVTRDGRVCGIPERPAGGGGNTDQEIWFKIGGQDRGSGGSIPRDIPNMFSVGEHIVTAEVTYRDGSKRTYSIPAATQGSDTTFTVTPRTVGPIHIESLDLGSALHLHASANAGGGGSGNYISWFVNGDKVQGPGTDVRYDLRPSKPTSHTDSPVTYNVTVVLSYGNPAGDTRAHIAGTGTKIFTFNPPPAPLPPELQITESVTMYGDTAEIKYAFLHSDGGLSLAWKTSQWQIKSGYVQIAERDGSNPVNLGGSYAGWIGDCGVRNLGFGRGYVPIICDIDNPSHRSTLRDKGYAFTTHHYYELSSSKVTAINALDDPYVFVRTDSDSTFKPVVKLSKPRG